MVYPNPSLVAQRLKRLPPMWETQVQSLGWEDPLEKEMVNHSSILAWRIPWTEKPGRLQSMGSQRLRHDWVTSTSTSLLQWTTFCPHFYPPASFSTTALITPDLFIICPLHSVWTNCMQHMHTHTQRRPLCVSVGWTFVQETHFFPLSRCYFLFHGIILAKSWVSLPPQESSQNICL